MDFTAYLREEYFYNSEVVKKVIKEGDKEFLYENCKVLLNEKVVVESSGSVISDYSEKWYKIISYPEEAQKSYFDTVLLSMKVGEEALIRFPYTYHNIPEAS